MVIQVGIQVGGVELLDTFRMARRDMCPAMCLRMTAPFLVSASPLSLECRGRLLVC